MRVIEIMKVKVGFDRRKNKEEIEKILHIWGSRIGHS
jgi:hypothetical protein